jgi:hypothetical protein
MSRLLEINTPLGQDTTYLAGHLIRTPIDQEPHHV